METPVTPPASALFASLDKIILNASALIFILICVHIDALVLDEAYSQRTQLQRSWGIDQVGG